MVAILLGFGLQSFDREDNNGDNNGGNNGGNSSVVWVDLGLPSGLLWADRNVGASTPEDYGNYYAWGETTPKNIYEWSTYAYGNNYDELTKYCSEASYGLNGFTDNLTVLQASDDAATVNLGGGARTPTKDQWKELIDHTTSTWITRNGVNGRLLTGFNGNSLFLPAAGYRYGSDLIGAGVDGYYWLSTLYTDDPSYVWNFDFDSYLQDMDYNGGRGNGFSVRAVRAGQN